MSSSPRTVIPSAPSPTNTMRTNRTAPPGTVNHLNVQHPRKVSQQLRNIDPRLQSSHANLVPPGPTFPHVPEPIASPMARFCHQEEQPWSGFSMGMRTPQELANRSDFDRAQDRYNQYHRGPCSDIASNAPASDSGYYTQPTRSVLSNDPGYTQQELPPEIIEQARNLNVESSSSVSQDMVRLPSDQRSTSNYSSRSGQPKQQFPCTHPGCSEILKCQSEHKYVKHGPAPEIVLTLKQEAYDQTQQRFCL